MHDLKLLFQYILERKLVLAATAAGTLLGAATGAIAFYQGWLG